MELLIKSLEEAISYVPNKKTYAIRIEGSWDYGFDNLKESNNWLQIKTYCFDDIWPKEWKEYSWIDLNDPYFNGKLADSWDNLSKKYPLMTKQSLLGLLESRGQAYDRAIIFEKSDAVKIINDFNNLGAGTEAVLVHCKKGQNRSPAIGIALNEIFNWEIEGLKENYPDYRRYVYSTMLDAGKEIFSK
jgi:hypothetical protein